ncbi:EAL domain-containing protein [Aquabacterium sp. J223]|uniref:EAL domain-containing protein n=1 Tax=Aquabacterium sp. J223 TaxID=2898431 RepID=UPI0021AD93D3|nr:EAL domain-containing protein [Aquabacterium sp. J223]UUX94212.1 EAL domain-containing protein [Aquabacterium sp. J223]
MPAGASRAAPRPAARLHWQRRAWGSAAVLVAYAVCAVLGQRFAALGPEPLLLGAPFAIALAALLRWGRWLLPACVAGLALPALALGMDGVDLLGVVGWPLAVALLAARGLRRFVGHGSLDVRQLLRVATAGVVLALPASAGHVGWLWFRGLVAAPQAATWLVAWGGQALAVLLVAVPLLVSSRSGLRQSLTGPRARSAWLGSLALLAMAVAAFVVEGQNTPAHLTPLAFVPHVLLCWLALRHGAALPALMVLVLAVGGLLLTAAGAGPFAQAQSPAQGLALLAAYLGLLAVSSLVTAALTEEMARNEDRWQRALEGSDLGVADWNLAQHGAYLSRRWRDLLGMASGADAPTPDAWLRAVHEDDAGRVRAAIEGLSTGGRDTARLELRLGPGGDHRWVELHLLAAERDAAGRLQRLVATLADISERREAEARQRLSASLFQHLHEGLLITDAELRVLDANPTYSQITGVPRQALIGRVPALLDAAGADEATRRQHTAMWASLRASGTWRGEMLVPRPPGPGGPPQLCALQVTISTVQGADGRVRFHALVISDITEQRQQRERLERQAHFDELTRLPNRARMSQMLSEVMAASEREGFLLAVCYLDLDHFKPVNDRFGHAAGDRLLVELAGRLRGALRSNALWSDAAARLGGDEFVLLLRANTLDEARLAIERVLRVITMPYSVDPDADPVVVTASVGATVYPLDRSDADTLLRHADHAMYSAKQSGRNGYVFFDPENSRRTEERVMAIGRVQDALDHQELVLHYQPKVDMRRGLVLGMEALLRWNHPEHGLLPPAQFLPLIEPTGLSASIGDWVLEHALEQLAHWQRMGLDLSISVNVSARHLQEPDFVQRLTELLARHPRPLGARLELEVLETAALADVAYTSALMERCRRLGVRFSLDDFGTGYSTLTYLKQLPVDVLKIDRSFVHNMLDDTQDLAIVQGVIGLARTFGCSVVAEGVELPAQARTLIELGCDIGQGRGLSAPMPAHEVFRWVRDYKGPFAAGEAAQVAR